MTVTSGFFNSVNGDRLYNADQMNMAYKRIVSNGVIPNPSTALQVRAFDGMTVTIEEGSGIFGDKWAESDGMDTLTLTAAHATLNRIDLIVMRCDTEARLVKLAVKTGSPASTPVAPALERSNTVKEYALASIYVAAKATVIMNDNITDTRSNPDLCGYTTSLVKSGNYAAQTIEIPVSAWALGQVVTGLNIEDAYIARVPVIGVTDSNAVMVSADRETMDAYLSNGVVCSGQELNTLLFSAVTKPAKRIKVNIFIF